MKNKNSIKDKKLIIYEINELPPRLLKFYIKKRPQSALATIFHKGKYKETFTYDVGHLHPWSTWPTLHRGVGKSKHQINYINQDLSQSEQWPPIWKILSEHSIDVGVFGSLQSYPPIENSYIKFYLPDTFAPDDKAFPKLLSRFQSFNLNLVQKNKAVSSKFKKSDFIKFLLLFLRGAISFKISLKIFNHILKEKVIPIYKTRRSIFQPLISFELFFKFLKKEKPQFSTFFTNHLAGMMHRYWRHLFPEDFELDGSRVNKFFGKSILIAMDLFDSHLKKLINFCDSNSFSLMVLSSMGQKARYKGPNIPELVVSDFSLLIKNINLIVSDYQIVPAMQPDICVICKNDESLEKLILNLKKLVFVNGEVVFKVPYKPINRTINLSLQNPSNEDDLNYFLFNKKKLIPSQVGFTKIERERGSAYHTPEGIMLMYGEVIKEIKFKDKIVDTREICPKLLDFFKVKIPDYMIKNNLN